MRLDEVAAADVGVREAAQVWRALFSEAVVFQRRLLPGRPRNYGAITVTVHLIDSHAGRS